MAFSGERNKTCCFTGHRDITPEEKDLCCRRITRAVEALVTIGVTEYVVGGALGFDTVAAVTLINLKRTRFPQITVTLAIPFRDQCSRWSLPNRALYNTVLSAVDKSVILSDTYHSRCMSVRNRYMVDKSAYCLSYVKKNSGGAFSTSEYAKKNGLRVLNLAEVYWE